MFRTEFRRAGERTCRRRRGRHHGGHDHDERRRHDHPDHDDHNDHNERRPDHHDHDRSGCRPRRRPSAGPHRRGGGLHPGRGGPATPARHRPECRRRSRIHALRVPRDLGGRCTDPGRRPAGSPDSLSGPEPALFVQRPRRPPGLGRTHSGSPRPHARPACGPGVRVGQAGGVRNPPPRRRRRLCRRLRVRCHPDPQHGVPLLPFRLVRRRLRPIPAGDPHLCTVRRLPRLWPTRQVRAGRLARTGTHAGGNGVPGATGGDRRRASGGVQRRPGQLALALQHLSRQCQRT